MPNAAWMKESRDETAGGRPHLVFVVVPAAYVLEETVRTLGTLDRVEHERDSWQRPDEILRQLDLHPG